VPCGRADWPRVPPAPIKPCMTFSITRPNVRYGQARRWLVRIVSETVSGSLVPELLDTAIAQRRKAFGVHA
jgi:hypothetical protein